MFNVLQVVFRKVADLKREQELMERRKNEPPTELAKNHPVRKLFSRFRRMSDRSVLATSPTSTGNPPVFERYNSMDMQSEASSMERQESFAVETPTVKSATTRWDDMSNGGGPPMDYVHSPEIQNGSIYMTKLNCGGGGVVGGAVISATAFSSSSSSSPPKPSRAMSKWGKLLAAAAGNRQETIVESAEESSSSSDVKLSKQCVANSALQSSTVSASTNNAASSSQNQNSNTLAQSLSRPVADTAASAVTVPVIKPPPMGGNSLKAKLLAAALAGREEQPAVTLTGVTPLAPSQPQASSDKMVSASSSEHSTLSTPPRAAENNSKVAAPLDLVTLLTEMRAEIAHDFKSLGEKMTRFDQHVSAIMSALKTTGPGLVTATSAERLAQPSLPPRSAHSQDTDSNANSSTCITATASLHKSGSQSSLSSSTVIQMETLSSSEEACSSADTVKQIKAKSKLKGFFAGKSSSRVAPPPPPPPLASLSQTSAFSSASSLTSLAAVHPDTSAPVAPTSTSGSAASASSTTAVEARASSVSKLSTAAVSGAAGATAIATVTPAAADIQQLSAPSASSLANRRAFLKHTMTEISNSSNSMVDVD